MIKVNIGLWPTHAHANGSLRKLVVHHISIDVRSEDHGRMQAWFLDEGPDAYHTDEFGDVYDADDNNDWLLDFAGRFIALGFSAEAVACINFSESGAQTPEYVDFDIHGQFVKELRAMFPHWAINNG